MSTSAKQIVKDFYNSDFINDHTVLGKYMHPEVELIWNSTDGLSVFHFDEIIATFQEIARTYNELRIEVSHVLEDDDHVTIRYKYYVRTLENPDEELGIAHFIAIWQVKDGKLYRGHQVSQPAMNQDDTNGSYHKVKV
jgi:ketosteroid isomerase-like protein|tara:strand:- start:189 stop:602 length:414 start_codon:yes stop_codon:yes gene_type:complete